MSKTANIKSPITTHVLDTATGKPAANIPVKLYQKNNQEWDFITQGVTNDDGRITDWIKPESNTENKIEFGIYKLVFELDAYTNKTLNSQDDLAFYPLAEICFRLQDNKHHHIPLLLSPFGYSTYRGS